MVVMLEEDWALKHSHLFGSGFSMNVWRDESHRPRNGPILKAEEIIGSTMSAESATRFSLEFFPKLRRQYPQTPPRNRSL